MNLNTERLTIRKFEITDWQAVFEYMSDPTVMKFIPEGVFTEESAKSFVTENMGNHAEKFAVVLRNENVLIGHIVFQINNCAKARLIV